MKAILHTNHGDISIELFPNQAPKTVDRIVLIHLNSCS